MLGVLFMKKIIIIFTGGTICMKKDEETGAAVPAMSGSDILEFVPELANKVHISFMDFGMLPSPHITLENMLELSKIVNIKLEEEGFDGVIITHGTDSMEETAFFIDLTYNGSKPVIVTGAMKNNSEPGFDGAANLRDSVIAAVNENAKFRGVMVVMNGEIHSASQVTKTSTHALETFKSLDFGPIGLVDNDRAYFYCNYNKRQYIPVDKIKCNVDIIKCGCGMDDRLIRFCADSGSKGIVIEGMGRGNIPPRMVPGVEYAIAKGIVVVLVSRCPKGKVMDDYGYEGAGRDLVEKGVLRGDNLNGQKARIKLIAALSYTNDISSIKDIFEKDFY